MSLTPSKLDPNQVLRYAYDDDNKSLRVRTEAVLAGVQEVLISDADDSIKIGNGSGTYADVNGSRELTVFDNGTNTKLTSANTTLLSLDSRLTTANLTLSSSNTSLSSLDTKITKCNTDSVRVSSGPARVQSTNNSWIGHIIVAGDSFQGTADDVTAYASVDVTVTSDKALFVDLLQSYDGVSWQIDEAYIQQASSLAQTYTSKIQAKYFSLELTNVDGTDASTSAYVYYSYAPAMWPGATSNLSSGKLDFPVKFTNTSINAVQSGVWNVRNQDGSGTALTSTLNGAKQSLDVNISNTTVAIQGGNSSAVKVDGSAVTQPISAASLPLPNGAAQDRTTALSPFSVRLTDGAAFYKPTTPGDIQPISASSLPLPAGAASDAILTGGTQRTKITDGSNNAAVKAATTAAIASDPALVVAVSPNNSVAITASSLPLPTGAATSAKQPALGTAGTASSDVISVQGIASMTPLSVSQSGTWTMQPGNTANTTPWLMSISDGTDTAAVTAASTAAAAADKALVVALSPNNGISLGVATSKTNVLKTGSLTTSAATADQVVLTYTVTAAKTFYLQYLYLEARLTTLSATGSILGTISLETPSGTKAITHTLTNSTNEAVEFRGPYSFAEPIPIAAGVVVRVVCTPAATTSMLWIANFGGYEK